MFVSKPDRFSSCIIIPGRTADPDGFVTENRALDGITGPINVYFSVAGLRRLAQKHPQVGLVPREELELAQEHLADSERLLADAVARVQELEAAQERIAGLVRDGFKVQKIMGRPKKEQA